MYANKVQKINTHHQPEKIQEHHQSPSISKSFSLPHDLVESLQASNQSMSRRLDNLENNLNEAIKRISVLEGAKKSQNYV